MLRAGRGQVQKMALRVGRPPGARERRSASITLTRRVDAWPSVCEQVAEEHHLTAEAPQKHGLYDPRFEHDSCGVGFVVDVKGRSDHGVVSQALSVLDNMRHRGASGSEANTGDGAGILLQVPHRFLLKACRADGIDLPEAGSYGVGLLFLPKDRVARRPALRRFRELVEREGQRLLGYRRVPTVREGLGRSAIAAEPAMVQVFIAASPSLANAPLAFERKLYVIRRLAEKAWHGSGERLYIASLSHRTLTYKGMLKAEQLRSYFPDLSHPSLESALAVVHSRFSTNTFPSWERAHPYRMLAHNGEVNTIGGNYSWMHTREAMLSSALWGDDLQKLLPIIDERGSDSAMMDNCLEFLTLSGRSPAHAMMMMIPEPYQGREDFSPAKKGFYAFHACFMQPWDGPAAVVFTDGTQLGATLDRSGLRPARYYVTDDDRMILASEVGVCELPHSKIVRKGRLQPGRMLLVDTKAGRIVTDAELKATICTEQPYHLWVRHNMVDLDALPAPAAPVRVADLTLLTRQRAFGFTAEEIRLLLVPMAATGHEAIGSMGTDTPIAALSERPRLLYDYFMQLFAQVTNPPIDAIREQTVMSTSITLGPEHNLLEPGPECARVLKLRAPVLTNEQLATITGLQLPGLRSEVLPILWDPEETGGLEEALEALFDAADEAIDRGAGILVLSDRGMSRTRAPIPALLATSALHHHLIRDRRRTRVGLVVESGEPREVHHLALLVGYGAAAVNPYLALETVRAEAERGQLVGAPEAQAAEQNYLDALIAGLVKVISKMGISTVHSYCGAAVFEALGLSRQLVDRCFGDTPTRLGGIGADVVATECRSRHLSAWPDHDVSAGAVLPSGGEYQWRRDGAKHMVGPTTIHFLQRACRSNNYALFKEYSALIDERTRAPQALRGLLQLRSRRRPVPLEEVEGIPAIVARFKTGAMSYGSISQEAHEALAIAMNRLGGRSNTGEGGEHPDRNVPDDNGDLKRSAIRQVASGRFGVTSEYLVHADEIQIKMAQGAKPGEGGQLPGHKVSPWIAEVRHSTPGVGLISPPPHHDIYSIEDLAQLIWDLKCANDRARISVKLVSTVGVGTIAAGVAKAHADVILISGYDGGTGAAALTSIKHAGVPWELGLAETHQTLVLNGLRSRVRLETDGGLRTGRDVLMAALLGAEEFGFATTPLIALGCVMMRACQRNTCPVGVATQDPRLRARFRGDPEHVVNFMRFVAQELREDMARLGFRSLDELVGRTDLLVQRKDVRGAKARCLDLSAMLVRPRRRDAASAEAPRHVATSLDRRLLIELCEPALARREAVRATLPVRNTDRSVGTTLASEVTRRYGRAGLADETIQLRLEGTAGQSFGAFLAAGISLVLEGDANDYVGKGLCGGRIIVYPPRDSRFVPADNVVIGNVALYGGTSGEAFIRGIAGERFAVRNSGVSAVVEGIGDHGCEYMTGGRVVVLGSTGPNFAAGMSGGIAWVLDTEGAFERLCNRQTVELATVPASAPLAGGTVGSEEELLALIRRHALYTGSDRARSVLAEWPALRERMVRVVPRDYRRVLGTSDAAARLRSEAS